MSKPSYLEANVEIAQHTFSHLIARTNQLIYDMGTVVLTAGSVSQPNTINGALTDGNAYLNGIFGANTVVVTQNMRGGTHSASGVLTVSSDINMNASANIAGPNINIGSSNTALLNVNAEVGTDIIPRTTNSIRLGAPNRIMNYMYSDRARIETEMFANRIIGREGNTNITIATSQTTANTTISLSTHLGSSSGGPATRTITLSPTAITPSVTNVFSLGTAANRWSSLNSVLGNFTGNVTVTGSHTTVGGVLDSNNSSPQLFPSANSAVSLNASSNRTNIGLSSIASNYLLTVGPSSGGTSTTLISNPNHFIIKSNSNASGSQITLGGTSWQGNVNLGGNHDNSRVIIPGPNNATALNQGALQLRGGASIDKNLIVGESLASLGNLAVYGDTTLIGPITGTSYDFAGNGRIRGDLIVDGQLLLTDSDISITVDSSTANDLLVNSTLTLDGVVNSNLVPNTTASRNLGSEGVVWNQVYSRYLSVRSNSTGRTQIRRNTSGTTLNYVNLPDGNVSLRTGSVAVLTDKFTDLAGVSSTELRGAVSGTTGTGSLVFADAPIMSATVVNTSINLRNGSTASRSATITNPATANTSLTLPTSSGAIARIQDIGTGVLTVSGGTGMTGSGTFNANATGNSTITLNNNDRGSTQAIFKNIANSGGTSQFSASTNNDTVRFAAGTGLAVVFVPASNTVRIDPAFVAGSGMTISGGNFSVDSTVVRTSGNQTIGGTKTFSGSQIIMTNPNGAQADPSIQLSGGVGIGWNSSQGLSLISDGLRIFTIDSSRNAVLSGGGVYTGNGSGLTNLVGSNISSGTVADARLPSTVVRTSRTLTGGDGINAIGNLSTNRTISVDSTVVRTSGTQSISGTTSIEQIRVGGNQQIRIFESSGTNYIQSGTGDAGTFQTLGFGGLSQGMNKMVISNDAITAGAGVSFTGSGSGLTSLNASNLSSGTIADARLPSTAVRTSFTLTGGSGINTIGNLSSNRTISVDSTVLRTSGNQTRTGTLTGTFAGTGSGLTSLNASNLSSGTVADARLPSNIVRNTLTLTGGSGISTIGNLSANRTISVDSTVLRTSGNQSASGTKTFTGTVLVDGTSATPDLRIRRTNANWNANMAFITEGSGNDIRIGQGDNQWFNIGSGDDIRHTQTGVWRVRSSDGRMEWKGVAVGNGSGITDLNASNISAGQVPTANLNNVRNFIAGMTYGSVGTYALLIAINRGSGIIVRPGSTRAGSNLAYAAASGRSDHPGSASQVSPSGTWRNMGFVSSYSGAGSWTDHTSVWLRIS